MTDGGRQKLQAFLCFFVPGAALVFLPSAMAAVPSGPPTFSHPLAITNTYFPFVPGAVKVFSGRDHGDRTTIVDIYTSSTRTFSVGGDDVDAHVLQETEFENGEIAEISRNYFAQADDGTVYYFGEIVDEYENGVVTAHGGSWLVGGPTEFGDPAEAANAAQPAVFMPAQPEEGDIFKPEDVAPTADETDEVIKVGQDVATPAGRFTNAIRVVESSTLDSATETKWYVPGVGPVRGKTQNESFVLIASTLAED